MTLDEIRKQIDNTDKDISVLIEKRMNLALYAGKIKKQNGEKILNAERENAVVEKVCKNVNKEKAEYIREIYKSITENCRNYEMSMLEGNKNDT